MTGTGYGGIDVSATELTLAYESATGTCRQLSLSNDSAGHAKLVRVLTKGKGRTRAVVESSGIYSFELALALHRARRVEVMVANPKAVKDFAGALMRRSKTDPIDAEVLLQFARRMPFVPWQPPRTEVLELRAVARRIESLLRSLSRERNRLHAANRCGEFGATVREDLRDSIQALQARLARLRRDALQIIAADPLLQRHYEHLVSVRGISDRSAIHLLAELEVLPADMTVRQWVAHAGLDPRWFESGTSVSRKQCISKKGNRHLRRALFMPALVATQWEPHVQAFYERLLARGKTKMQAIVAVMRKLLHAIYGMLKHDHDFVGEKFFALTT